VKHTVLSALGFLMLAAMLAVLPACSSKTPATVVITITQTSAIATVVVTSTSTAPSTMTGSLKNGQDIFLTAVDAFGQRINAGGFVMMGRWFACADCHGQQGHGGTVYMMMAQYDVPNITWPSLTGPDYIPPFTVDLLKRAITQGLDEKGKALDPFMPRWTMSSTDLSDLVAYIQTLT
jgi:cytochrome c oxidase subunit II